MLAGWVFWPSLTREAVESRLAGRYKKAQRFNAGNASQDSPSPTGTTFFRSGFSPSSSLSNPIPGCLTQAGCPIRLDFGRVGGGPTIARRFGNCGAQAKLSTRYLPQVRAPQLGANLGNTPVAAKSKWKDFRALRAPVVKTTRPPPPSPLTR